ncbi:MAG: DUF1284 domain-containing protein [Shinella sp.]|nr:DUF1284 domain-containing protein [Shinella sp.]
MTIRLRSHHLLCMLTFVGEGYTPSFVENYRRIAGRLSAGENIEIVEGPDDICAPLLGDENPHCRRESVAARDREAALALAGLIGSAIVPGLRIVPDAAFLGKLRLAFRNGRIRSACCGCEWSELCTQVAGEGYPGILIGSPP